jgi:hypothetical protein
MGFVPSSHRHVEGSIARIDSRSASQHDTVLAMIRERERNGHEFAQKVGAGSHAKRDCYSMHLAMNSDWWADGAPMGFPIGILPMRAG